MKLLDLENLESSFISEKLKQEQTDLLFQVWKQNECVSTFRKLKLFRELYLYTTTRLSYRNLSKPVQKRRIHFHCNSIRILSR
ncbi:hypothetical protein LEP1GSC088_2042 [Leptospira interrogans str. L1207]|nr:hypothetical protein LEP1GSC088_2042 [Leptospira interrogans str. L1207]